MAKKSYEGLSNDLLKAHHLKIVYFFIFFMIFKNYFKKNTDLNITAQNANSNLRFNGVSIQNKNIQQLFKHLHIETTFCAYCFGQIKVGWSVSKYVELNCLTIVIV